MFFFCRGRHAISARTHTVNTFRHQLWQCECICSAMRLVSLTQSYGFCRTNTHEHLGTSAAAPAFCCFVFLFVIIVFTMRYYTLVWVFVCETEKQQTRFALVAHTALDYFFFFFFCCFSVLSVLLFLFKLLSLCYFSTQCYSRSLSLLFALSHIALSHFLSRFLCVCSSTIFLRFDYYSEQLIILPFSFFSLSCSLWCAN